MRAVPSRLSVALLVLTIGCATPGPRLADALKAMPEPTFANDRYMLACPDVVQVMIAGRPELNGAYPLSADGGIAFDTPRRPRLDGLSTRQAASAIAAALKLDASDVSVLVGSYRSRHVILTAAGKQSAIEYRGPEKVSALLRRAGEFDAATDGKTVHLIRARADSDEPPQVFKVDLPAVLSGRDAATDVEVEPFDQLFLGELAWAKLQAAVPAWARPAYRALLGVGP